MARLLKAQYPERKIATRTAPNFLIRFLALFDPSLRTILPLLGKEKPVNAARAKDILGMSFKPADDSIQSTAEFLIEHDLV